jgi:hypothetical protein
MVILSRRSRTSVPNGAGTKTAHCVMRSRFRPRQNCAYDQAHAAALRTMVANKDNAERVASLYGSLGLAELLELYVPCGSRVRGPPDG